MEAMSRHFSVAPSLTYEPVLAVCGWSGSGKTTLLEQTLQPLCGRGLRIAVVKHDVHGIDVDRPGKDSDRLFKAGANVLLAGPSEELERRHAHRDDLGLIIRRLLTDNDLVLVEGHKATPLPKVWLASANEHNPPAQVREIIEVLPWSNQDDHSRCRAFLALIDRWLPSVWRSRPRLAGIMVGGASTRMGRPKQLLPWQGQTLLDTVVQALQPLVDDLVISGAGRVPPSCSDLKRLPDINDLGRAAGPLAGMLACQRWAPRATWFFVACDLPLLVPDALQWLEAQRGPGRWAVLPRVSDAGVEPLLAVYEPQSRSLLEQIAFRGDAPRHLTTWPSVLSPTPPTDLASAWTNINCQAELERCTAAHRRTESPQSHP